MARCRFWVLWLGIAAWLWSSQAGAQSPPDDWEGHPDIKQLTDQAWSRMEMIANGSDVDAAAAKQDVRNLMHQIGMRKRELEAEAMQASAAAERQTITTHITSMEAQLKQVRDDIKQLGTLNQNALNQVRTQLQTALGLYLTQRGSIRSAIKELEHNELYIDRMLARWLEVFGEPLVKQTTVGHNTPEHDTLQQLEQLTPQDLAQIKAWVQWQNDTAVLLETILRDIEDIERQRHVQIDVFRYYGVVPVWSSGAVTSQSTGSSGTPVIPMRMLLTQGEIARVPAVAKAFVKCTQTLKGVGNNGTNTLYDDYVDNVRELATALLAEPETQAWSVVVDKFPELKKNDLSGVPLGLENFPQINHADDLDEVPPIIVSDDKAKAFYRAAQAELQSMMGQVVMVVNTQGFGAPTDDLIASQILTCQLTTDEQVAQHFGLELQASGASAHLVYVTAHELMRTIEIAGPMIAKEAHEACKVVTPALYGDDWFNERKRCKVRHMANWADVQLGPVGALYEHVIGSKMVLAQSALIETLDRERATLRSVVDKVARKMLYRAASARDLELQMQGTLDQIWAAKQRVRRQAGGVARWADSIAGRMGFDNDAQLDAVLRALNNKYDNWRFALERMDTLCKGMTQAQWACHVNGQWVPGELKSRAALVADLDLLIGQNSLMQEFYDIARDDVNGALADYAGALAKSRAVLTAAIMAPIGLIMPMAMTGLIGISFGSGVLLSIGLDAAVLTSFAVWDARSGRDFGETMQDWSANMLASILSNAFMAGAGRMVMAIRRVWVAKTLWMRVIRGVATSSTATFALGGGLGTGFGAAGSHLIMTGRLPETEAEWQEIWNAALGGAVLGGLCGLVADAFTGVVSLRGWLKRRAAQQNQSITGPACPAPDAYPQPAADIAVPPARPLDGGARQSWLDQQPNDYPHTTDLNALVKQIDYVPHAEFVAHLDRSTDALAARLGNLTDDGPIYVVWPGDGSRSGQWVFDMVRNRIQQSNPALAGRLEGITDLNKLPNGKLPGRVIVVDDASYSGGGVGLTAQWAYDNGATDIHILVPYTTAQAKPTVSQMVAGGPGQALPNDVTLTWYDSRLIRDGEDIATAANVSEARMNTIFGEHNWRDKTLTYFDHKVPDSTSLLAVPRQGSGSTTLLEGPVMGRDTPTSPWRAVGEQRLHQGEADWDYQLPAAVCPDNTGALLDSDNDLTPDDTDLCMNEPGLPGDFGCPLVAYCGTDMLLSDNGIEPLCSPGCTDPIASNYDALAQTDDGSCSYALMGCTDPIASNFDSGAQTDDGSCSYALMGCTDPIASNYDASAQTDDGSCSYMSMGCTDPSASNYDASAQTDDGSCSYDV